MSCQIKLIVGLGNPGPQYTMTRHNAGAWFVEQIAEDYHISLKQDKKFSSLYQKILFDGYDCHLLIPQTFMNHSGRAVAAICQYYNIQPEEILVAHDELDFEVGKSKIKKGGGHAGHNGLRDIIKALNTQDFYRLRIGIDHPGHKQEVHNYVLSAPSKSDRQQIQETINDTLRYLKDMVAGDINKAIQALHTQ
jgi:peptidyl-tRNA hydrolase, PTH1 family